VATVVGNKFFRRGVTKLRSVAAPSGIANAAATPFVSLVPTAAEAAAMVKILDVSALNGFSYANQPIPTPDLDDNFDSSIVGVDAAENSSIEFYERIATNQEADDSRTVTYRTRYAKGLALFIAIYWGGHADPDPVAGSKAEIWPVQSAGPARLYDLSPTAAKWRAPFSPTQRPATDVVIAV
jgi:hypothetical protein